MSCWKKISVGLLAFSLLGMVGAMPVVHGKGRPNLSRVVLNLNASQWVETTSAKVIVQVNATVGQAGLAKLHQQIMRNLNKVASGSKWHVTAFNRSQDASGLETVRITAEARVDESALAGVRPKVKALTRPGSRYKLVRVNFQPSKATVEAARGKVRAQLYQDAKAEVARLNATYPGRRYRVRMINFSPWRFGYARQATRGKMLMRAEAMVAAPTVAVSNRVTMTARVVLASDWAAK